MATWAPKIPEKEREETSDAIERKAEALAGKIRRSKHFVVFTGAGVSTSAGACECAPLQFQNLV